MAGGMGRPGANIGSGVGAGLPQGGGRPMQAGPQQNAPMPVFNAPAISPMQQYMQSIGINRTGYNPQAMASQSYAAARAPQNFKPAVMPNAPSSGSGANDPAKPTDYQKMRDELDQLRAWQANYTGNQGNDGGGYR